MYFIRQNNSIFHSYFVNDDFFLCTELILFNDLGIYYSVSLKFDYHINTTVNKAKIKRKTAFISFLL